MARSNRALNSDLLIGRPPHARPYLYGRFERWFLAAAVAAMTAACSSPSSDPVAYSGMIESCRADREAYGEADCACFASAFQANLDPSFFAVMGRYYVLKQQELIYSDGTPVGGAANSEAYKDLRAHYQTAVQKEAAGGTVSNLTGLVQDLKSCGGAFAEFSPEAAASFAGDKFLRAFSGLR